MTIKMHCEPDNHRWEFWHEADGLRWERCLACSESRYDANVDHQGC